MDLLFLCATRFEIPNAAYYFNAHVRVIGIGNKSITGLMKAKAHCYDFVVLVGFCGCKAGQGLDIGQLVTPNVISYDDSRIKLPYPYEHSLIKQCQFGTYDDFIFSSSDIRDKDVIIDQESYHLLSFINDSFIIVKGITDIIFEDGNYLDQQRSLHNNSELVMDNIDKWIFDCYKMWE